MFKFAFLIGLYSYLIFFLGIFGFLYKNVIVFLTAVFLFSLFVILIKSYKQFNFKVQKLSKLTKTILVLLTLQIIINLVGVLGPEISFDALWYHLTLPKIFLEANKIFFIPGNLFYYSTMPKLTEMYYLASLAFGPEIIAKFIHFGFGLLTLGVIYKLARKFISIEYALLAVLIFYSNLVVGWVSITAYVDLSAAFFSCISFYYFLEWVEKSKNKNLIYSGAMAGFAISAKVVLLNLIPTYLILLIIFAFNKKNNLKTALKNVFIFLFSALASSFPWFVFSFLNTGNLFYPLFEKALSITSKFDLLSIVNVFLFSNDPISPIYLISLPLIILYFLKFNFKLKLLVLFSAIGVLMWYLNSSIGGSRFILPYLSVFSVVIGAYLYKIKKFKFFLIGIVIFISLISIGYRFVANYKYLPFILGLQTKQEFLSKNLNFEFGDFYDTDFYFKNTIKEGDKVLLFGFHNLYYVDFPFIDSSYIKRGEKFNYIATQNTNLPYEYKNWKEIYYNNLTNVKLYSKERQ